MNIKKYGHCARIRPAAVPGDSPARRPRGSRMCRRLPQFSYYVLEKCGHDPWKEKYARKRFLDLLEAEVNYLIKPAELRTSRLL